MVKRLIPLLAAPFILQQPTAAQVPLPAAVGLCLSQPIACAVISVTAAGWYLQWRGHQPQFVPKNHIHNPDQPIEEYREPVLADNEVEALRLCKQKANRDGVSLVRVMQPRSPRPGRPQQYTCVFRSNSPE